MDTWGREIAGRAEARAEKRLQAYYRRWTAAERRVKALERELADARQKAAALRGQVRAQTRAGR
jgi:predicted  nucleic acid-binding Zn-ribbon protein